MDTTTFILPKELAEANAEIARRDGHAPSDVIRTALEIYAERARANSPTWSSHGSG